ncbi:MULTISPECIES: hypothetical protein [Psychrobacter]|uniref:hypothetical protein n=1 Tax=Psychrobacter TaxID=497 RepID=UPI00146ADC4F|nr:MULTISPECIES: hypothetical protein [Psychrobacter]
MIKDENHAYIVLAECISIYASDDEWIKANMSIEIYSRMIRCFESLIQKEGIIDEYRDIPIDLSKLRMEAVFYLRDHFLKLTGNRIWGLTFTLYPDGKFEIKYDYDKPEGYEETDEVITGDEINQTFLK